LFEFLNERMNERKKERKKDRQTDHHRVGRSVFFFLSSSSSSSSSSITPLVLSTTIHPCIHDLSSSIRDPGLLS